MEKVATQKFNQEQLEILENMVYLKGWADLVPGMKDTLQEFSLDYIRSERIEGEGQEKRDNVAFHVYMLCSILDDLKQCEDKADKSMQEEIKPVNPRMN